MKKILVLSVSLSLGIALFLYILFNINTKETLLSFTSFSPLILVAYLFTSVVIMFLLVFRWRRILQTIGPKIPFFKMFSYKISAYAISYLAPIKKIGLDPRTYLLWRERKMMRLSKGASSVMLDNILEISGDVIFALIGFIALLSFFSISKKFEITLIAVLAVIAFLLGVFFYRNMKSKLVISRLMEIVRIDRIKPFGTLKRWAKKTERHNIKFLRRNKKEVMISFAISFLLWILMFVEYKFALLLVGYNAGIREIFIILTFIAIAYLVPIPAALGVLEVSQISAFSLLGISIPIAIALSFLIRARDLLWTLIGIGTLYEHGFGALKNYMEK